MSTLNPKFSIFSHSLGACSAHSLPAKLRAAANAGFLGIEIFQADLTTHSLLPAYAHLLTAFEKELAAAEDIGRMVKAVGMETVCLQPLRDLGLRDAQERKEVMKYAEERLEVMDALGTDLLICCSSCRPKEDLLPFDTPENVKALAEEIGELADKAEARGGKRIALEALSFGTQFDKWGQAWEIVKTANRDNLGVCLDTFNSLGREWADPSSPKGTLPSPHLNLNSLMTSLASLPPSKFFFLQIADAALLSPPLHSQPCSATQDLPARMFWSRTSRLFPCEAERGGYLPVEEFVAAVADRFAGRGNGMEWWSLEVFNDSLAMEGAEVPREHAERGLKGLKTLRDRVEKRIGAGKGKCKAGKMDGMRKSKIVEGNRLKASL